MRMTIDDMSPDAAFQAGIKIGNYLRTLSKRRQKKWMHFRSREDLYRHMTRLSNEPLGDIRHQGRFYDDATFGVTARVYFGMKGNWKTRKTLFLSDHYTDWLDDIFTARKPSKMHTINHVRRYVE